MFELSGKEQAMASTATAIDQEPLKVYWQPGCTGCLKTKEFLTKHGVAFVSINVLEDKAAFDELATIGVRRVPIVRRGKDWVDGQVLSDLARIAGVNLRVQSILAPAELALRVDAILSAAQRFAAQIPEETLDTLLPKRPRSYRQLVSHIAQIVEAFLDLVERGRRLELAAYNQDVPAHVRSRAELVQFVAQVQQRFDAWWQREGETIRYSAPADVYYGQQSLHEFFERTTWHAGQHTRQLQLVVEKLGIDPNRPLIASDLAGLPMPENVWDDQMEFA
jgi:glutaredoxin